MEIPVYIITGFLESGKTTFIKEILKHNLCNNCLKLQKLPNINEII